MGMWTISEEEEPKEENRDVCAVIWKHILKDEQRSHAWT